MCAFFGCGLFAGVKEEGGNGALVGAEALGVYAPSLTEMCVIEVRVGAGGGGVYSVAAKGDFGRSNGGIVAFVLFRANWPRSCVE